MTERWNARQFHNQPEESHQHQFLVGLWTSVRDETGGRFDCGVHAQNGSIPGSDPQALPMLISGTLEFYTLMGGALGDIAPAMLVQGLPFAFSKSEQIHRAMDGELGGYLRAEMTAKGLHCFPHGLMENGFRQISSIDRPIRSADDLAGFKIRVPPARFFTDVFTSLGADPKPVNIRELYHALEHRLVDGQENPLVITEVNRLYEVTRHVSITNHMWSGFNMLANLEFWTSLPSDVQETIQRNVTKYVAQQRAYTMKLNHELEVRLAQRGLVFTTADAASFRRKLGSDFYRRWKTEIGARAWNLLEAGVGRLG